MKNISSYPKPRGRKHQLEIWEREISDWQSIHHLPLHISAPEIKSHRGGRNLGKISHAPRVCQINAGRENGADLAVDILRYQLGDRVAQQKHLENVRRNLEHRSQVAESQGNKQLLNILQDEYRQLETSI